MKKHGTPSGGPSSAHYLKRRVAELATAKTRSQTDPLAAWALKRIRLDGRPFGFEGHEYLRGIYDDASPHVVLSKAAQMRGMQSTVGMKSVPADMIVFDELDEATPDAKALARERLAHSDYKRIIELSNPSLPEYGIDESFQASDQRHWMLKCPACGTWTALEK